MRKTEADPSTSLRFGRDDASMLGRVGMTAEGDGNMSQQQIPLPFDFAQGAE
jgi:hypothetical protein